jgi:hypothetical protein
MDRVRGGGLAVGLFVCLPVALLLGTLPAVAWQLSGGLPFGDSVGHSVARGRIHRGHRVQISGTVQAPLSPGISSPIHLGFMNPNSHTVRIRRVRVIVTRVTAPRADAAHPCGAADFEVRQLRRGSLRIPAKRLTDLAGLGVPAESWPQLVMRNRPVNQDGCKGAQLTLKFRARRLRR